MSATPVARVLILNERDPRHPKAGGAEVHVAEIFGRLAARGHEVVLALELVPRRRRARARVQGMEVRRLGRLPRYYPRAAGDLRARHPRAAASTWWSSA